MQQINPEYTIATYTLVHVTDYGLKLAHDCHMHCAHAAKQHTDVTKFKHVWHILQVHDIVCYYRVVAGGSLQDHN
jgi:hypothetical protein